jgi:tRNA G18 (ribose-2'-O)-methylase SpoU
MKQTPQFVLILPNIRSGHNVGAMFRTADGAGVSKVYLVGYSPVPPHPQVDKVSLGAEKVVPFEHRKTVLPLLKQLKADGFEIVGLEQTSKSVTIYEWQPKKSIALIVGNEKTGITKAMLKHCDSVVHLPMKGVKNSLNVSIAGGVAMYHISHALGTL